MCQTKKNIFQIIFSKKIGNENNVVEKKRLREKYGKKIKKLLSSLMRAIRKESRKKMKEILIKDGILRREGREMK